MALRAVDANVCRAGEFRVRFADTITGGRVTHDGKNIGSSHIHGGVVSGGDLTDVPAN